MLSACEKSVAQASTVGKVVIVGAGAAGLTAGYLLQQYGLEFQILEASPRVGGRMKHTTTFADFPISLGAEWIHVPPSILKEIINDDSVPVQVGTTTYNPETDYGLYNGVRISLRDVGFDGDSKFINSSWLGFFEHHVVPSVQSAIIHNAVVDTVDYSADVVHVHTQERTYSADRAIVTVPVKMLQNEAITFIPALPESKQEAISKVKVWDGCKAFIEFSERFYPAFVGVEVEPGSDGQKLYYDASYGQDTRQHILGLFAVGSETRPYVELSDGALIDYILHELDALFDGRASATYVKHLFQNWNEEPYARGAYVVDRENWSVLRTLGKRVGDRLFFAGDAYTNGSSWSSVDTAARSASRAVRDILRS
ncbi:MAG: NAD(P)/FAD-dependent oxidoreductase [Bacteroidota bacterium]